MKYIKIIFQITLVIIAIEIAFLLLTNASKISNTGQYQNKMYKQAEPVDVNPFRGVF